MARVYLSVGLAVGAALVVAAGTSASVVSIKLTTNALGLGNQALNDGSTVDPDIAGKFITSSQVGMGSILYIQRNGLAGSNDLLATVTARSRLDTVSGLTFPNDYQAGVIYMTPENTSSPDGRDEGIGVRPFTVSVGSTNPLRTYSNGLARIEGSKEISGGTGPSAFDPSSPNGAPHVDEDVLVSFAPGTQIGANSLGFTVSKFGTSDQLVLTVTLAGGSVYTTQIGTNSPAFTNPGADVYNVALAGLGVFGASDVVQSFAVRAIDPNPAHPSGTAEHFLLTGFTVNAVPAPAGACVLGLAGLMGAARRRR